MMVITEGSKKYSDIYEIGAFAGATKSVSGIKDCVAVLHGVQGCNREADHLRTAGTVVNGNYMPAVIISLGPVEVIQGKNDDLIVEQAKFILNKVKSRAGTRGTGKLCWILTSCAPSIIMDDIEGAAARIEKETGVTAIALDSASFLGGIARGAELTWIETLKRFGREYAENEKEGINLVGPQLTGSFNWPNDSDEIVRLLGAADVKVNHILFRNISVDQLPEIPKAKANVFLSQENFGEFEEIAASFGMENFGQELPLPIGIANTETWYYELARKYGNENKAKMQLKKDIDMTKRITKYNWNATWALTAMYGKHVAILGPSSFAVSMARCLFYDFNLRPTLVGLVAETEEGLKRAERLLEPISPYLDFEVLENPSYFQYAEKLKEHKVDFAIGSAFDKHLTEGIGVPHLSLAGVYFKNNWNFVPWPTFGVRGILFLMGELWKITENAMAQPQLWKALSYQKRDEVKCK